MFNKTRNNLIPIYKNKGDGQNCADTRIKLIHNTVGLGKEKGFKL